MCAQALTTGLMVSPPLDCSLQYWAVASARVVRVPVVWPSGADQYTGRIVSVWMPSTVAAVTWPTTSSAVAPGAATTSTTRACGLATSASASTSASSPLTPGGASSVTTTSCPEGPGGTAVPSGRRCSTPATNRNGSVLVRASSGCPPAAASLSSTTWSMVPATLTVTGSAALAPEATSPEQPSRRPARTTARLPEMVRTRAPAVSESGDGSTAPSSASSFRSHRHADARS